MKDGPRRATGAALLATPAALVLSGTIAAAAPPIRTSAENAVPACVTVERLTAFLATRNASPEPRFRQIAELYRRHGKTWQVRWDYAFFQMALETNFLQFRRGNGKPGDVRPRQNNFAGLGTTGGGVPGDSYPDVSTGVLAQIQHLVAYSGERVPNPVGPRTRLKQDDIISASRPVAARRPVTFQDLSRRWAVDRAYGRSIDTLARLYAEQFCKGTDITVALKPEPVHLARRPTLAARPPTSPPRSIAKRDTNATPPRPAARPRPAVDAMSAPAQPTPTGGAKAATPPSLVLPSPDPSSWDATGLSRAPAAINALRGAIAPSPAVAATDGQATTPDSVPGCSVRQASFGGTRTLLILRQRNGQTEMTALGVHAGFETAMGESYIKKHAPGGVTVATFESKDAALAAARSTCPSDRRAG